jgi:small subunit ribosomal protein S20
LANHKSSAKRARQTVKKTERNRRYISAVRTAIKKLYAALDEGKDAETVGTLLKSTQSMVSKAAAKGYYHKNKAFRTISRLTKASAKTSEDRAQAAPGKKKKKVAKKTATKKKTTKKKTTKKKTSKKK